MWLYTIYAPDSTVWQCVFDFEVGDSLAIAEFKKDTGHDMIVSGRRSEIPFIQRNPPLCWHCDAVVKIHEGTWFCPNCNQNGTTIVVDSPEKGARLNQPYTPELL